MCKTHFVKGQRAQIIYKITSATHLSAQLARLNFGLEFTHNDDASKMAHDFEDRSQQLRECHWPIRTFSFVQLRRALILPAPFRIRGLMGEFHGQTCWIALGSY